MARPDTLWYRTRKYVRRNLISVSLAALSILLLLSGLMYAIWQTHVARQIAEQQRRQLYAAEIQKTMTDWEAGKITGAQQRLERLIPAKGTADWRGFEWYYLQNLLHQEDLNVPAPDYIQGTALSPDGKIIATGTARHDIRLRNALTGQELLTWKAHDFRIVSLAISFDHQFLLSTDQQGYVKLWETATGHQLLRLDDGLRFKAMSAAFSASGKSFGYTLGNDAYIRETATGKLVHHFSGNNRLINLLSFSPDEKSVALGFYEARVQVWDSITWRKKFDIFLPEYAESIVFSPDAKTLACGSVDNIIYQLDAQTGKEIRRFSGHRDFVLSTAFSPDGKLLASIGRDRALHLHQVSDGKELLVWPAHNAESWYVAFMPDGQRLLTSDYQEIKSWSLPTLRAGKLWQGDCNQCQIHAINFLPFSNLLVSGDYTGAIRFFDLASGKIKQTLTKKEKGGVLGIAVAPAGRWVASTDYSLKVRLWDVLNGKEIATLKPPSTLPYNPLAVVAIAPDGKTFATGGMDARINLWNTATQQVRQTLTGNGSEYGSGYQEGIFALSFSPDGRMLASGGSDGMARLWNAQSGQELHSFTTHKNTVQNVAFSPDGKLLATASWDATVKIWELATKREIAHLTEHADEVYALAFSPDGRRLATGSKDATIRIWDTETWQPLLTMRGHASQVWALAFSADGKTLASASQDKTIRLWRSE